MEGKFKAMDEEDDENESSDGGSKTSKNSKYSHSQQKSTTTQMAIDDSRARLPFEYSIDMSQREVIEIMEKQRRSKDVEMGGPFGQLSLHQNKPDPNCKDVNLPLQNQRVTFLSGAQFADQAVFQVNQQPTAAVRLSSTLIQGNNQSINQVDQNVSQTHQQQSGFPPYLHGQCAIHSQARHGPPLHQYNQNVVNPQVIPSQQMIFPSIQQHQAFPTSSQSTTH